MGRNAKPISLVQGHRTKAEIKHRKENEITLGSLDIKNIQPPDFVKGDTVAYKRWKHEIKNYQDAAAEGIEILTTADIGQLALYCKTYSEYENLLSLKTQAEGLSEVIKLETATNRKMDMLLKMQDRLFLNPLARVKNVPKKPIQKQQSPMGKFLSKRYDNPMDEFGV